MVLSYYPALLDVRGREVLVIGGGPVAARKVGGLLAAGAVVRLVAPELCAAAVELALGPGVGYHARGFEASDLDGVVLVFCASGDGVVNARAAALARSRGIFVNVVDAPEAGDMIVPAHFRRGELLVAVATGGASPALSRRLRQRLEVEFGPEWGPLLRLLAAARRAVLAGGGDGADHRRVFYELVDSRLAEFLRAGDWAGVDGLLRGALGLGLADLGLGPEDLQPRPEDGRP